MGFSPLGLALALAVLAPNLILAVAPARGMPRASVPAVLTVLERAGQAACLVVPVIVVPTVSWPWLVPTVVAVLAYWALWGRYLATGREGASLYAPVAGVPVPMAILPVAAFGFGAVWLGSVWLGAAAAILAAGHIPASAIIARTLRRPASS